jgi:hypothetical protein
MRGGGWLLDERGQFVAETIVCSASVLLAERSGAHRIPEL